ncbi:MAG: hypothetical protein IJB96_09015 [Lachnospira sp.]|nr:hypothetical protein [Lachnospira sp.]
MADIISGKFGLKKNNRSEDITDSEALDAELDADELAAAAEEDLEDAQVRVRNHRIKIGMGIALAIVLVVIFVIAVPIIKDNITYSGYSVVDSVNCDDSESTKYISYLDGYIKYSNDGVSYYNGKGVAVWNQTVSMSNPQIKVCHDAVAVGDINGSTICVFNKTGMLGTVDTSLAISQIEVAKQGVVAAVLEDNEANYINLYNTDGSRIYSVKTSLAGDGYPLDVSISDDATKLVASYLYVSGENVKTNVVFYNFSDVGQNETERVVGGFNHYDSTIVGDVTFINKTTAVAIGENVLSIYTIKEYPKEPKDIAIENEIDRVFFSDQYIGLVLNNSDSTDMYKLQVYDTSGKKVCESTFNMQYDGVQFDGKSIVMYNSSGFVVMNLNGKVLADLSVELPLEKILTTGTRGKYVMVNSKYIQNIKLK